MNFRFIIYYQFDGIPYEWFYSYSYAVTPKPKNTSSYALVWRRCYTNIQFKISK